MDPLIAARAQMAVSLGFHMPFAALGIGLPLLLVIAEGLALRTGAPHYLELARRWGKATAVLFAVGAVSGTALSFELGLLWPRLMGFAGSVLGPPFALEGYAFFLEAIFIGLYLYGWDRLSPRAHWLCGIPVAVSGVASGVLVVAANAWMQAPCEFEIVSGRVVPQSALAAFRSRVFVPMAIHSTLACYAATGFGVAGVYALGLLRGRRDAYHRSALAIALAVGTVASLLQPLAGDLSARAVARHEPVKLAAMEAHFATGPASLWIGGIPDPEARTVRFGLEIPRALSFLVARRFDARIPGLEEVPPAEWPNVLVTHLAFETMVGSGVVLGLVSLWFWAGRLWRREPTTRFLRAVALVSPLGFVALEAGWVVTEVGRQPWTIAKVLLTREAVTPASDVPLTFFLFTALYGVLGVSTIVLLRFLAAKGREAGGAEASPHA